MPGSASGPDAAIDRHEREEANKRQKRFRERHQATRVTLYDQARVDLETLRRGKESNRETVARVLRAAARRTEKE